MSSILTREAFLRGGGYCAHYNHMHFVISLCFRASHISLPQVVTREALALCVAGSVLDVSLLCFSTTTIREKANLIIEYAETAARGVLSVAIARP